MLVGYEDSDQEEADVDKNITEPEIIRSIKSQMQEVVTAPNVGNIEL